MQGGHSSACDYTSMSHIPCFSPKDVQVFVDGNRSRIPGLSSLCLFYLCCLFFLQTQHCWSAMLLTTYVANQNRFHCYASPQAHRSLQWGITVRRSQDVLCPIPDCASHLALNALFMPEMPGTSDLSESKPRLCCSSEVFGPFPQFLL